MRESNTSGFRDNLHKALGQWSKGGAGDFLGGLLAVQEITQENGVNVRQAAGQALMSAIDILEQEQPEQARLLRLRYLDGFVMQHVANRLNRSEPACYRLQRRAIDRVAQILEEHEQGLRKKQARSLLDRLGPPPYGRLFGIEEPLDHLMELVQSSDEPWLIVLQGIGGIGKTSLADALMRVALTRGVFQHAGWISARPYVFHLTEHIKPLPEPTQTTDKLVEDLAGQVLDDAAMPTPFRLEMALPALRKRLSEAPHLIVADNLETVADLDVLLHTLRQLACPSKIILTSRHRLHAETHIYHFAVPELLLAPACQLLCHEAWFCNECLLTDADDEFLCPIFDIVGGNPLALHLVVSQSHIHDLPTVLNCLKTARGRTADQFYTFIYRRAWDSLDENAQRVFLAMPLAPPRGMTIDLMGRVTGLDPSDILDSLDRLVRLNLVDRKGDLQQSRYSIHPLTQTFLQEQAARWRQ